MRRKVSQAFLNASHRKKFENHWLRVMHGSNYVTAALLLAILIILSYIGEMPSIFEFPLVLQAFIMT